MFIRTAAILAVLATVAACEEARPAPKVPVSAPAPEAFDRSNASPVSARAGGHDEARRGFMAAGISELTERLTPPAEADEALHERGYSWSCSIITLRRERVYLESLCWRTPSECKSSRAVLMASPYPDGAPTMSACEQQKIAYCYTATARDTGVHYKMCFATPEHCTEARQKLTSNEQGVSACTEWE